MTCKHCERPATHNGMCKRHYTQVQRHGVVDATWFDRVGESDSDSDYLRVQALKRAVGAYANAHSLASRMVWKCEIKRLEVSA